LAVFAKNLETSSVGRWAWTESALMSCSQQRGGNMVESVIDSSNISETQEWQYRCPQETVTTSVASFDSRQAMQVILTAPWLARTFSEEESILDDWRESR
jgi:hypothetical protein